VRLVFVEPGSRALSDIAGELLIQLDELAVTNVDAGCQFLLAIR
jgi:hypothetical protein